MNISSPPFRPLYLALLYNILAGLMKRLVRKVVYIMSHNIKLLGRQCPTTLEVLLFEGGMSVILNKRQNKLLRCLFLSLFLENEKYTKLWWVHTLVTKFCGKGKRIHFWGNIFLARFYNHKDDKSLKLNVVCQYMYSQDIFWIFFEFKMP